MSILVFMLLVILVANLVAVIRERGTNWVTDTTLVAVIIAIVTSTNLFG